MTTQVPNSSGALQSLIGYLDNEYFSRLKGFCAKAETFIEELNTEPENDASGLYAGLSKKLIDQVGQYIQRCQVTLNPYLQELMEKNETGHDCRNCSSSCTIRHTAQVLELQQEHLKIQETLGLLKSVALPSNQSILHQTTFKNLVTHIHKLDVSLTELFYLEQNELIPKVQQVQNAIHAHS